MTRQEAYQILGISENTTTEQIKQTYKKQAKKYHPDIYRGDKKFAEEKMKQINEAYSILSEPRNYSSYQSSAFDEYMKAKREYDEQWKKIQEDLERIQKEMEEENKKMKKMLIPLLIILFISLILAFISLFVTLVKSIVLSFNESNWLLFSFDIASIVVYAAFGVFCIFGFIWMWKKMFE